MSESLFDATPELLGAMRDIRRRLDELNHIQGTSRLPALQDAPMDWTDRVAELEHRMGVLRSWAERCDPISTELLLDTILAHAIAFKLAIHREETARRRAAA